MTRLTDAELAELERLEKAGSEAPWTEADAQEGALPTKSDGWVSWGKIAMREVDYNLSMAARNALPRLLTEVRELRAREQYAEDTLGER